MSSVYDWSVIAADNANSDAAINWAEGQPPSTVNNSARAMMQRVKELVNDLSGVAVSGGTANSLTATVSSGFVSYADGLRVSFRGVADNTGATTINVNSIGSKPVVKFTSAGEVALSGGEIQANGIYELVYSEDLNGAAGAWLMLNPTDLPAVAPGFISAFGGVNVPTGYLSCNGAAISRTTYADLFAAIGTTWGVGDGSTTFNTPDLRDDFIRGASGTLTVGTKQSGQLGAHTHTGTTSTTGAHTHTVPDGATGGGAGAQNGPPTGGSFNTGSSGNHSHTFTTDSTGGAETRPRNGVVLFVIKT